MRGLRDTVRSKVRSLRLKLASVLLIGVVAAVLLVIEQSNRELSAAYAEAGKGEVLAIARSFAHDFRVDDVRHPRVMRRRIDNLARLNPSLEKVSVYARDGGRSLRIASTDQQSLGEAVEAHDVSPLRTGRFGYKEEHEDGEHLAELNYPLKPPGAQRPSAVLGIYYDLTPLDAALAKRKRALLSVAAAVALVLAVLMAVLFERAVFRPLQHLRLATRRLSEGHFRGRLQWRRADELGALADDFDAMADDLEHSHQQLRTMAMRDPLTDVLNHRAFQERLDQELSRAAREGYPVSLLAVDVDGFKKMNDTWGHAVGDELLRLLARELQATSRSSDIAGRVGGDEFMLILPGTGADDAAATARRLVSAVAVSETGIEGIDLTVSVGVAEFPSHAADKVDLVRFADGAMYWAKQCGGSQAAVYSEPRDQPLSPKEDAEQARRLGLINTVHALAKAVDAKDAYTHQHSRRVATYAVTVARALGIADDRISSIETAAILHDVGKIGVPESILLKPGPLTAEEIEVMRRHSRLGEQIIAGAGLPEIAIWVCHLHERFDGRGYPDGLAAEEIPFESRILHVVDAFEAMTAVRVYRDALPLEQALHELKANAGKQFDPGLVRLVADLARAGKLGDPPPVVEPALSRGSRVAPSASV